MKRLLVVALAAVLLPWQLMAGASVALAAPIVFVSTTSVQQGAQFQVSGSGFTPAGVGATARICILYPNGTQQQCQASVSMDTAGNVTATAFVMPLNAPLGINWQACITNNAFPAEVACAFFSVIPGSGGVGSIIAVPTVVSGGPGVFVTVNGSGWQTGTNVTICVVPNANVPCVVAAPFNNGTFSTTLSIPQGAPAGQFTIQACVTFPAQPCNNPATYPLTINQSANCTISPTTVQPGGVISISGSASGTVTAVLYNSTGTAQLTSNTQQAAGSFSMALTVPAGSPVGNYSVQVTNASAGGSATICQATVQVTLTAQLTLTPTVIPPGGGVTVRGTNFIPGQSLTVSTTVNLTTGAQQTPAQVVAVQSDGTFTITLSLPGNTAPGSYTVTVYPTNSPANVLQSAVLTVQSPATIGLSTTTLAAGAAVTVTGTGYLPGEAVQLQLSTNGTVFTSTSGTADNNGNFSISFPIPGTTPPGTYTVIATGTSSRQSTQAALTVTISPVLTVSPSITGPNTTVTVSGQNFAPNTAVSISAPIGLTSNGGVRTITASATATSAGTFSAPLLVPPNAAAGSITVTAAQSVNGVTVTKTATFTIQALNPSITFSPTSSLPGSTISISLTGFAPGPNAPVTISTQFSINGSLQPSSFNIDTNSSGNVSTTLAIPAGAAPGTIVVTATQPSSGVSTSGSLTVLQPPPPVTPAPTSTPTPPPPPPTPVIKKMRFQSAVLTYQIVHEGSTEILTVQANQGGKISITIQVIFPSGVVVTYRGFTNSKGHFSVKIKVPKNVISGKNHTAFVKIRLQKGDRGVSRTLTFGLSK